MRGAEQLHLVPTFRTRGAIPPHPHIPLWNALQQLYFIRPKEIDLTKPYNVSEMKYDQQRQKKLMKTLYMGRQNHIWMKNSIKD